MDEYQTQPQQPAMQMPYMNALNSHAQNMVQMTSTDMEISSFRHALRCEEDLSGTIAHYGDPLMNDVGVFSVVSQLQSLVHRITIMSNLDEFEITRLMESFCESLVIDLMFHKRSYGIKKSEDRTKIVRMAINVAYTCIKRSYYGDDKKLWGKIQSDITQTIISTPGQNSGSWLKRIGIMK